MVIAHFRHFPSRETVFWLVRVWLCHRRECSTQQNFFCLFLYGGTNETLQCRHSLLTELVSRTFVQPIVRFGQFQLGLVHFFIHLCTLFTR